MYTLFRDKIGGDRRGVSHVLGVVLLVGIVMASVGLIAMVGASTIGNSQDSVEYERAKLAMGELGDAAHGTSGGINESVDFGPGAAENVRVDESAGNFTVRNVYPSNGSVNVEKSRRLGKVVYEGSGREVAMQGGGVWEKTSDANGSAVFQRPPVDYRNQTKQYPSLTMSIVQIDGESRSGFVDLAGTTNVSELLDERALPPETELQMVVTSDYYDAWGSVFENQIGERFVDYDDENQTVQVTLTVQRPQVTPVTGAIVSPTGNLGNTFDLKNTVGYYPEGASGTPTVLIGSSSGDSDPVKLGGDGTAAINGSLASNHSLEVTGELEIRNKTYVFGDLNMTSPATFKGPVYIHGDVHSIEPGTEFKSNLVIGGDLESSLDSTMFSPNSTISVQGNANGNIPTGVSNTTSLSPKSLPTDPNSANSGEYYVDKNSGIKYNNSNSAVGCINTDNETTGTGTCSLSAGDYYLTDISNPLDLDTTGGDINIYMDDKIMLSNLHSVKHVAGSGSVNMYYNTSGMSGPQLMNIGSSEFGNMTGHASKFTLYVNGRPSSESDIYFNNGVNFTGLIYGLAGEEAEPAEINMGGNKGNPNTFNGAVLGKVTGFNGHNKLFYDLRLNALGFGTTEPSDTSDGEVRYIYISDVKASAS